MAIFLQGTQMTAFTQQGHYRAACRGWGLPQPSICVLTYLCLYTALLPWHEKPSTSPLDLPLVQMLLPSHLSSPRPGHL